MLFDVALYVFIFSTFSGPNAMTAPKTAPTHTAPTKTAPTRTAPIQTAPDWAKMLSDVAFYAFTFLTFSGSTLDPSRSDQDRSHPHCSYSDRS